MYAFAGLKDGNAQFWSSIREGLPAEKQHQAPMQLCAQQTITPKLAGQVLFAQTCGLPYRMGLHQDYQLLATPDYGLPDAPAGYYYSHIIAHRDDPRNRVDDFIGSSWAVNSYQSQSGFAALVNQWPDQEQVTPLISGSHANSLRAVANRQVECAAIDAVSLRFLKQFDNSTHKIKIIANTTPTPGLPFITGVSDMADDLRHALQCAIPFAPLGIKSLVDIDHSTYLSIPTPTTSQKAF